MGSKSRSTSLLPLLCIVVALVVSVSLVQAEDDYKFYTWTVTYGILSPLGTPQQVSNQNAFSLDLVTFKENIQILTFFMIIF